MEFLDIPNLKYHIQESVLEALISSKSTIALVDDKDKILACALGMTTIDIDEGGTLFKCIMIAGTLVHSQTLVGELSTMFATIALTKDCMKHVKGDMDTDREWYVPKITFEANECGILTGNAFHPALFSREGRLANKYIKDLHKEIEAADRPLLTYYTEEESQKIAILENEFLTKHTEGAYTVPFMSQTMLNKILKYEAKTEYKVNDDEKYSVQIPEIVLGDRNPKLYELCQDLFIDMIIPLAQILYMHEVTAVNSIQLAKYTADAEIAGGNWHADEDSTVTLVVNLTKIKAGGGTILKPYGSGKEVIVPPLEPGEGFLFRGKYTQHKGLPVTEGDRKLLVFWTE